MCTSQVALQRDCAVVQQASGIAGRDDFLRVTRTQNSGFVDAPSEAPESIRRRRGRRLVTILWGFLNPVDLIYFEFHLANNFH